MGRPTRLLGSLAIASVVGCSQTALGDEVNQPAAALLVFRFIDGPNLDADGHDRAPADVDPRGVAALIANKDSTLVKCFCRLWDQTLQGYASFEAGAAILYDQRRDDFYCAPSPLTPQPYERSIGIPEGTVGTVHTHPNYRSQYPSAPEDYGACRVRPGFVLTKYVIWGIAPGCQNRRCAHKLANGDWYRRVCHVVEKRDVISR